MEKSFENIRLLAKAWPLEKAHLALEYFLEVRQRLTSHANGALADENIYFFCENLGDNPANEVRKTWSCGVSVIGSCLEESFEDLQILNLSWRRPFEQRYIDSVQQVDDLEVSDNAFALLRWQPFISTEKKLFLQIFPGTKYSS